MVTLTCPLERMSQHEESLLEQDTDAQQLKINLRQDIGRAKNGKLINGYISRTTQ